MPKSSLESVAIAIVDRDGTLIEDTHYPRDPSLVRWLPGAVEGLRAIQEKGYEIFIISNQSGVGRGLIQYSDFLAVHRRFQELADEEKISLRESHYCFDVSDKASQYRKPQTGMLPATLSGRPINWGQSLCIGDRASDLELGLRLKIQKVYLVRTGLGTTAEKTLPKKLAEKILIRDSILDISKEV